MSDASIMEQAIELEHGGIRFQGTLIRFFLKLSLQEVDERVLDTVSGWLHEQIAAVNVKNDCPVRYSG